MKLSEKDKYIFFKRKNIYTYKFDMQKLLIPQNFWEKS